MKFIDRIKAMRPKNLVQTNIEALQAKHYLTDGEKQMLINLTNYRDKGRW